MIETRRAADAPTAPPRSSREDTTFLLFLAGVLAACPVIAVVVATVSG